MKKKIFNNRNYVKLILATFITRFGDAIDSIALSWMVYVLTGSKLLMGTLFVVAIIPNLIILPFSGVMADAFDKKKLTVISDIARGLSVVTMAVFYYFDILEVWHLFMFVIINSIFESFANPSRGALLPLLIDEDDYVKGSSYLNTSITIGELIGVSITGVLIATIGIWGAIFIDGMTFFASAVMISLIKYKEQSNVKIEKEEHSVKKYFVLIKDGLVYVRKNKILISLVWLAAFINFSFVPFNILRPVYVDEVLKMGAEGMSYLGMAFLIGMIVGGLIVGKVGDKIKPIKSISFGLAAMSLAYASLGIAQYIIGIKNPLVFIIIFTFVFGGCLPFAQSPMRALRMKSTSKDMMGRITSISSLISLCAMPLGGALVGFIGDSISVSNLFIIMGLAGFIVTTLFAIKNRNYQQIKQL